VIGYTLIVLYDMHMNKLRVSITFLCPRSSSA
jgi:hypothetical protein